MFYFAPDLFINLRVLFVLPSFRMNQYMTQPLYKDLGNLADYPIRRLGVFFYMHYAVVNEAKTNIY